MDQPIAKTIVHSGTSTTSLGSSIEILRRNRCPTSKWLPERGDAYAQEMGVSVASTGRFWVSQRGPRGQSSNKSSPADHRRRLVDEKHTDFKARGGRLSCGLQATKHSGAGLRPVVGCCHPLSAHDGAQPPPIQDLERGGSASIMSGRAVRLVSGQPQS